MSDFEHDSVQEAADESVTAALQSILHPPPLQPICECGSMTVIENHGWPFPGQKNGMYCHRGHYLPGQDMPTTTEGAD